nr:MAG TPA: hypothetical protein [Caudoviricetes sp.]
MKIDYGFRSVLSSSTLLLLCRTHLQNLRST